MHFLYLRLHFLHFAILTLCIFCGMYGSCRKVVLFITVNGNALAQAIMGILSPLSLRPMVGRSD
jgi:hypothetical protein